MGLKDEVRQAKQEAEVMQCAGEDLNAIATKLNCMYEGFYYVANNRIYCENSPDYLPPLKITA